MAHFCEHMLFLGSDKYPDLNHYQEFLSANGGDSNGFTNEEQTHMHFSVNSDKFDGALDIFSAFFKSPLFNSDAADREINAIQSEFEMALKNEIIATD